MADFPLLVQKVVSSLPDVLTPHTIYLVRIGQGFDLYVTDSTGKIAHKINQAIDVYTYSNNVWSFINNPVVQENGTGLRTIINADEHHFKMEIQGFRNGIFSPRFDSCLSDMSHEIVNNAEYMISFNIKANKNNYLNGLYVYFGSMGTFVQNNIIRLSEEWQTVTARFKANGTNRTGASQLFAVRLLQNGGWTIGDYYELKDLSVRKIERISLYDIRKLEEVNNALVAMNDYAHRIETEIERIKQHLGIT